jgi:hypothetical protein
MIKAPQFLRKSISNYQNHFGLEIALIDLEIWFFRKKDDIAMNNNDFYKDLSNLLNDSIKNNKRIKSSNIKNLNITK